MKCVNVDSTKCSGRRREQWPHYNASALAPATTMEHEATPAAFREQLDGSYKRVPYLNIYECDPCDTSPH